MSVIVAPNVEFAFGSFVHSKLADNAPLHANSAGFVADFQRQFAAYFNNVNTNTYSYSPPIWVVDGSVPTVKVKPFKPWDSNFPNYGPQILGPHLAAVPLPSNFAPSPGTDLEAVIYRPSTYEVWEMWVSVKTGAKTVNSAGQSVDEWGAAWGGHIPDIRKSPGYFPGGMGTQATGIAFMSTIMTIKEQQTGVIRHPLQLEMPECGKGFVAPAQRGDGWFVGPNYPVQGSHWRFPANIDFTTSNMNKYALMIATAIRDYGMILSDTAGAVVLRTENPMSYQGSDPYSDIGGIWGAMTSPIAWQLNPYAALKTIPWAKLQVLA